MSTEKKLRLSPQGGPYLTEIDRTYYHDASNTVTACVLRISFSLKDILYKDKKGDILPFGILKAVEKRFPDLYWTLDDEGYHFNYEVKGKSYRHSEDSYDKKTGDKIAAVRAQIKAIARANKILGTIFRELHKSIEGIEKASAILQQYSCKEYKYLESMDIWV